MTSKTPVLVTGGTGFIGARLVSKLLARNIEVVSFALPGESVPDAWQDKVKVIRGDITKQSDVTSAMTSIGTVIHLAAIVGGSSYDANWQITVEGSRNIFDAALFNNTKVVLASSVVVYGDRIRTEICHEGLTHGNHQGPYSRAKMAQEKLAIEYRDNKGMQLSVIRPANVYGAGSGPWVNTVFQLIKAGMTLLVDQGAGNAGLVHVDNLVDAFLLAAELEQANGQIYTVCDQTEVTWHQYFTTLGEMIDQTNLPNKSLADMLAAAEAEEDLVQLKQSANPAVLPIEFVNLIGHSNRFDSSKIRSELGWQPITSFEEAMIEIKASIDWSSLPSKVMDTELT